MFDCIGCANAGCVQVLVRTRTLNDGKGGKGGGTLLLYMLKVTSYPTLAVPVKARERLNLTRSARWPDPQRAPSAVVPRRHGGWASGAA